MFRHDNVRNNYGKWIREDEIRLGLVENDLMTRRTRVSEVPNE